jgi:hypothetical protein
MPFALDEIRKFGREGHEVYASDTFKTAAGSRSTYVVEFAVTPRPRFEPRQYVAALREFIVEHEIEVLVPSFEDAFYIAERSDMFDPDLRIFAPSFETLQLLHDKARFLKWAAELGLLVPRTVTVTDVEGLREATESFGEYFARPVFSRGGVSLLTNTGPLAGAVKLEDCRPTAQAPWIVQGFMHGRDVCSFSVVHHGWVVAHSTYVHPRMIEHAGGITFESIDSPESLDAARRIAEATNYHGQLSLDFMETKRGLELVECNPRPTAGVYVMPDRMFVDAVLHPDLERTAIAPAGLKAKIAVALIRDMLLHLEEIPENVKALFADGRDIYADPDDLAPAFYSLLASGLVRAYRKDLGISEARRTDLSASYFHDVLWDGPGSNGEGDEG